MNKDVDWVLVAFVCIFALFCAFVSIILIFGSGIFVFELDYSEEQRQAANVQAIWISLLGFVGLCFSTLILILSVRVADFISRILAGKLPE